MPGDSDLEHTRRFAAGEVKRVLGIVDPTADRLFAKARTVLGADRASRCLELARLAPLSRRWVPTSAIAALVAGTADMGPEWWTRSHEELAENRLWTERGIPDRLLTVGHDDPKTEDGGSCLALLGGWIADDAADKQWGRPRGRDRSPCGRPRRRAAGCVRGRPLDRGLRSGRARLGGRGRAERRCRPCNRATDGGAGPIGLAPGRACLSRCRSGSVGVVDRDRYRTDSAARRNGRPVERSVRRFHRP